MAAARRVSIANDRDARAIELVTERTQAVAGTDRGREDLELDGDAIRIEAFAVRHRRAIGQATDGNGNDTRDATDGGWYASGIGNVGRVSHPNLLSEEPA